MRVKQAGEIKRSGRDYLIPVTIKVFLHKLRTTRLWVTGPERNTNVIAEDGKFVNLEVRNWAVSLVNQDIMKRCERRLAWQK